MTTNWRDKWQHRTRGGYEVVNVYMLHGLLRASIKLEGSRHPGYAVDENGKAISHSHKYDLLPITPPAEPVPQGYAEITIGGVKTLAKMDTASSLVVEHHVSGGTLMMVADDLADFRRDAERCSGLAAALSDLYAMVNGECPSLLNEDSGGNAELDLRIAALLAEQKKRAAVDALPDPAE